LKKKKLLKDRGGVEMEVNIYVSDNLKNTLKNEGKTEKDFDEYDVLFGYDYYTDDLLNRYYYIEDEEKDDESWNYLGIYDDDKGKLKEIEF